MGKLTKIEIDNNNLSLETLTIFKHTYLAEKAKRINSIALARNTNKKYRDYLKQILNSCPSERELRNFLNREANNATIDSLYRKINS